MCIKYFFAHPRSLRLFFVPNEESRKTGSLQALASSFGQNVQNMKSLQELSSQVHVIMLEKLCLQRTEVACHL